jgi:superfamily II RNA helicase
MVKICANEYPTTQEEIYAEYFQLFPYELSTFQKYSIEALITGNHSLVTAHTGSGKTLPADFAIQHFTKKGKKIIYCSPIKALSNQKYYDFTNSYPDIKFGLLTGDIKTAPDADVLIMTTEILMNYLFAYNKEDKNDDKVATKLDFNIDIENDLACVVFDEVHFINDKERGNVWEKCFMMLPPHVQLLMLSATIDNPSGFAEWIETKRYGNPCNSVDETDKIVYLSSTTHRIVPLTHYCFLSTNEGIFKSLKDKVLEKEIRDNTNTMLLLQDEKGKFNEQTHQHVSKILKIFETRQVFLKRQHILNSLALFLKEREMLPAIVFVFSRKNVERFAQEITIPLLEDDSKVPYTIRREAEQIIRKLPNYKEYLELPEYQFIVSMLEKGIGIHHSGLLPVIREIVELMISKKYVKMLFATESFAIGLNCAIKSAVFTSLKKFDGNNERYLFAGEYSQSSSRCGRRGLDKIGYVIHLSNLFELPTMTEYKQIMSGKPQKLVSKFHISYSVILNLIKNGQLSNHHMFAEKSMMQNELISFIVQQNEKIAELETKYCEKTVPIQSLKTPYETCIQYIHYEDNYKTLVNKKRKDAEREMRKIQDECRYLLTDIKTVRAYLELKQEIETEKQTLKYNETFIAEQTKHILHILRQDQFIQLVTDTEDQYCFTELGSIASNIAEIHPLIISKFMVETNYFERFSVNQLVGFFSCFTDIKIPSDEKSSTPNSEDTFLNQKIRTLQQMFSNYQQQEFETNIQTGIKYDDAIIFDMIDFAMKWCECSTEQECKYFIQNDVKNKSISIGDFNKAMLKIVTVSRELSNVCEQLGQIELLYKLSQVEGLILKYVTTSQSLYV